MRPMMFALGVCAAGLAAACNTPAEPAPELITEVGCVTASGGDYILTDLERAGDAALETRPTTEAYLLVARDDGMRTTLEANAGKRVQVSGFADPAQIAEIRVMSPLMRPANADPGDANAGHTDTVRQAQNAAERHPGDEAPRIVVGEQLRLAVTDLDVRAVGPTGETCQAM